MLKTIVKHTHKGLTVASLVLNGTAAANSLVGTGYLDTAKTSLQGLVPQDYEGYISTATTKLQGLGVANSSVGELIKSASFQSMVDSGIAGLGELYLSKSIFGQTTHFGLVPQALKCYYGAGQVSEKLPLALLGMGAFEVAYWWLECDQPEAHPEVA